MSPASEGSSLSFTYSEAASQNPNPNLTSNHAHQPQSSCFSVGSEECNRGLNFDFSKKAPDLLGQQRGRRLRYPLKKLRKKVGSENTKCMDSLGSDQSNENVTGTSSIPTTNIYSNVDGGCVGGKEGSHETEKFCNVGRPRGVKLNSFVSNSSCENKMFVFGATSSSASSFVFGAGKSSTELNYNVGYGRKNNIMHSNSHLKNENVAFGAEKSSTGFVFGATNGESKMKSGLKYLNGVFGANACESPMNSSTNFRQKNSSGTMGLSGAEKMRSFDDSFTFVFGATANKGELASDAKLEREKSVNRSNMQSEDDGSEKFGNVGSVSNGKKTSKAAENGILQEEDSSYCVRGKTYNMRGKVKLDAKDIPDKQGHSSFVFSTGISDGKEKDNSYVLSARANNLASTLDMEKSKHNEYAGSAEFTPKDKENAETVNEYQKAGTDGVFVFGAGGKEKLSSNENIEYGDAINNLNDEKVGNNSNFTMSLNDATGSNFKFVVGSSNTSAGAFYKIPLSKLFDEMKNLNIDDSKGTRPADQVGDGRSNLCFCSDQSDATQNNVQMSSGKPGNTLKDQHKDADGVDAAKCSDPKKADIKSGSQGKCEYEYNSQTDNSFSESVKVPQPVGMKKKNARSTVEVASEGVNSPFAHMGVLGKENQPANSSETTVHDQQTSSSFEAPPTKVESKENPGCTSTPFGFRTSSKDFSTANLIEPSSATNVFTESNKKFEFLAQSTSAKEKKLKTTRRKLRQRILSKPQGHLHKEGSPTQTVESPGGCTPMDFSPYQHCTDGTPASTSLATERGENDSTSGRQRFDVHENDKKSGEPDNVNSKGLKENNLKSTTSSSAQDGLSAIRRQYKKKYKLKIGDGLAGKRTARNAEFSSSSVNSSSYACCSFNGDKDRVQSEVASGSHDKTDREHTKQDTPEATTHGVCEHWRIRGNQAYRIGDLSKAEEFYTKGINIVKDNNVSGICSEPLLLCYSNRAATRMSLGRMREALVDCKFAAALDASFLKIKIRAANCHLVLGEFQEAMQYYNDCLESGNKACLDRKFTIEAADGLQKSQKVAECISQSAELMQERTSDSAKNALDVIIDALSISRYSEKLLEMKAEALFLLQRYDEVIELCKQTLQIAEKNVTSNHLANADDFECKNSPRLWRWHLMAKSHFHLGRLEVALDLIEKQEQLRSVNDRYISTDQETPIPLSETISRLLEHKKSGNEAFQSGKHAEAIEHYTAAISRSVESRPFAAICFCNRAAAYQALGQIVDAIADCSLAIALDGNYPKAVSRRATLYEMIRDYKQATDDLQRLINLLENQLKEQRSNKKDGSQSSNKKEIKQARHRLSIMEDMAKKGTSLDLYLILGNKESDTESDIKKAYRKAALRHHPDKVGQFLPRNDGIDDVRLWKDIVEKVHQDADRLFKMIGEAYAVLSDVDKRSKYDYDKEIRDFCHNSNRNTNSRKPSDFSNNSPYDEARWSSRQSHYYSSPSGRSRNRRNWQDSWRDDDRGYRW